MVSFELKPHFPINYAIPVYGYMSSTVICVTLVTNGLVLSVLVQKHMRTPTNVILGFIAVSDMFHSALALPFDVFLSMPEHYKEHVPYEWCIGYYYAFRSFPAIFHTASMWQTMFVTIQRYIYIQYSAQGKKWCKLSNILCINLTIYLVAFLPHGIYFFINDITPVVLLSQLIPNTTVIGCNVTKKLWYEANKKVIENVYLWFRVICIKLIPCVILFVLNTLLIGNLNTARKRRKRLLSGERARSESRSSSRTTFMLVIMVAVFLLVEIPGAIDTMLYVIQFTWGVSIYQGQTDQVVPIVINFLVVLSSSCNFFIYCGMNRQFWETFRTMFRGKHTAIH